MIIWASLSWVLGVCLTQIQSTLLPSGYLTVVITVAFVLGIAWGLLWCKQLTFGWVATQRIFLLISLTLLGLSYSQFKAHTRLADQLAQHEINLVTRVTVQVVGLPRLNENSLSVEVEQWPNDSQNTISNTNQKTNKNIKSNTNQNTNQNTNRNTNQSNSLNIPNRIAVTWPHKSLPQGVEVLPGQVWRMALRLRPVHGRINPGGFDQEGLMFAKGVRAVGQVRGTPQFIDYAPLTSLEVMANGMRHRVRKAMLDVLGDRLARAVLIALAIGDQQGVSREDWQIFSLTGITHLVSISGSHVTLIAALGGLLVSSVWRRGTWRGVRLSEWVPARMVSIWAAVITAFLYCLLAGWGVPAQRTFFMVLMAACGLTFAQSWGGFILVALAAALLTLFDPWAVLSTGFWLSFMAVTVLIMLSQRVDVNHQQLIHDESTPRGLVFYQKLYRGFALATQLQWVITLMMLPVLAWLFNQVSWVSIFANAVAIPVLTFVVTPFALILALAAALFSPTDNVILTALLSTLASLAHAPLEWTLWWVKTLAALPVAAFDVASSSVVWLVWALIGVIWAVLPPFSGSRNFGWFMLLPILNPPVNSLAPGDWSLHAFDIGQGSALLVRTQSHDLIFDVGWKFEDQTAMTSTIWPALRALGLKPKPVVVISHNDLDHIGGLQELKKIMPLGALYASDALAGSKRCEKGQSWEWSGVVFEFLHPDVKMCGVTAVTPKRLKNRCSCVLQVTGRHHSLLLTGDIDQTAEKAIVENQQLKYVEALQQQSKHQQQQYAHQQKSHSHLNQQQQQYAHQQKSHSHLNQQQQQKNSLQIDVVVVPHHGAATSSSLAFIQALQAKHAIAQMGYLNRFSHPAEEVVERWQSYPTQFWRTDHDGALHVRSEQGKLTVESLRLTHQRYWHHKGSSHSSGQP